MLSNHPITGYLVLKDNTKIMCNTGLRSFTSMGVSFAGRPVYKVRDTLGVEPHAFAYHIKAIYSLVNGTIVGFHSFDEQQPFVLAPIHNNIIVEHGLFEG